MEFYICYFWLSQKLPGVEKKASRGADVDESAARDGGRDRALQDPAGGVDQASPPVAERFRKGEEGSHIAEGEIFEGIKRLEENTGENGEGEGGAAGDSDERESVGGDGEEGQARHDLQGRVRSLGSSTEADEKVEQDAKGVERIEGREHEAIRSD